MKRYDQEVPMRAVFRTLIVLVSLAVVLPGAASAQGNPDRHSENPTKVILISRAQTGDSVGFDLAWNHVALSVPNIAESIAWYEKMLGFKGTVRGQPNPNARQIVADLRRGDITIELFQVADAAPLPESRKNPSEDFRTHGVKHFGFEVKNLPAVLAELKAKGVKMAFEMRDAPTERFAFISDNAGNAIELIEHKTR
jgi:methylmalonyl-CoA/ethylmalonyl-CoA epimerase